MNSFNYLYVIFSLLLLILFPFSLLLDERPLIYLIGPFELLDSPLGLIPVLVPDSLWRNGLFHALIHRACVQTMVLLRLVDVKKETLGIRKG